MPDTFPAAYVEEWIKQVMLKDLEMEEADRNYRDYQLVRRGYKAYKYHAVYQQKLLREGQFSPMLVRGLQKLHSLTAVTLQSGRPSLYEHKERRTGSTLTRVWSPLFCPPFELDLEACVLYVGG